MSEDTLLKFPCDFPIKALGRGDVDLEAIVTEIVRRHAPELEQADVRLKDSRNGRFHSVTATIRATSKEQLDAIYRDLVDHEKVIMAL
jgi:putative lipoic acid-binding regulatory protein